MMGAREIILKTSNLKRVTAKGKILLKGINLEIKKGEITGIIGRNGAGKSTLLKALSGADSRLGNDVLYKVDGQNKLLHLARYRAVLGQEVPASFGLSVLDILMLGRLPHGNKWSPKDYQIVDHIIELLNLEDLIETPYRNLSGGERQKVQFGRCLCQLFPFDNSEGDKLLFLDEPFAALDLSVQQLITYSLENLVREHGLTVVVILHDLNLVAQFCQNILLLDKGEMVKEGTPSEVLTEDNLREHFKIQTKVHYTDNNKPYLIYN